MLTDIYAAGEDPIPGVTVEALAEAIAAPSRAACTWSRTLDEVVGAVVALAQPGDVVITLGAGSIGTRRPTDARGPGRREKGRS